MSFAASTTVTTGFTTRWFKKNRPTKPCSLPSPAGATLFESSSSRGISMPPMASTNRLAATANRGPIDAGDSRCGDPRGDGVALELQHVGVQVDRDVRSAAQLVPVVPAKACGRTLIVHYALQPPAVELQRARAGLLDQELQIIVMKRRQTKYRLRPLVIPLELTVRDSASRCTAPSPAARSRSGRVAGSDPPNDSSSRRKSAAG